MDIQEARSKLSLAKDQLERVQVAASDPEPDDAVAAVTWAFYAYENAVVAAAEIDGLAWQKNHPSKVKAAESLHARKIVSIDVGSELENLNELRKSAVYGQAGPELEELDLEDLAVKLEEFVEEVAALIEGAER